MLKILSSTEPTLLFNANPKRKRLVIQLQSTNVDANNTGKVFIKSGSQPIAVVGHASQGLVLMQSDVISQPLGGDKLDNAWKDSIWATADTVNQSLYLNEEVEEAEG